MPKNVIVTNAKARRDRAGPLAGRATCIHSSQELLNVNLSSTKRRGPACLLGGLLYLGGMLIMAWNTWKTVAESRPSEAPIPAVAHA